VEGVKFKSVNRFQRASEGAEDHKGYHTREGERSDVSGHGGMAIN